MEYARDRVRVSGRVTDRVRVRRPDSSGNLLIWHKVDYAPGQVIILNWTVEQPNKYAFSFLASLNK